MAMKKPAVNTLPAKTGTYKPAPVPGYKAGTARVEPLPGGPKKTPAMGPVDPNMAKMKAVKAKLDAVKAQKAGGAVSAVAQKVAMNRDKIKKAAK